MIATCGFLTALECTKFVLAGAVLRTPLGELTVLPRPHTRFKGDPTSKWKGKGGEEMGGERRGGERGRPPLREFLDPALLGLVSVGAWCN